MKIEDGDLKIGSDLLIKEYVSIKEKEKLRLLIKKGLKRNGTKN